MENFSKKSSSLFGAVIPGNGPEISPSLVLLPRVTVFGTVIQYLANVLDSSLVWYCNSWQLFWYSSVFGAVIPDDFPEISPCLVLHYLATIVEFLRI